MLFSVSSLRSLRTRSNVATVAILSCRGLSISKPYAQRDASKQPLGTSQSQADPNPRTPVVDKRNPRQTGFKYSLDQGEWLAKFRRIRPTVYNLIDLRYEADVLGPVKDGRTRLIDNAMHSRDLRMWTELLEFRLRADGPAAARDIWHALCQRNIHLPTDGDTSDTLWTVFATCALTQPDFLQDLWEYSSWLARDKNRIWKHFVSVVLGHSLRHQPGQAMTWFRKFQSVGLNLNAEIPKVAKDACDSEYSLSVFRKMYEAALPTRAVYSQVMPHLCHQGWYDVALDWHEFLLSHDDRPPTAEAAIPLLKHLFACGDTTRYERVLQELRKRDVVISDSALNAQLVDEPSTTQASFYASLDEVYGIEDSSIGDTFAARMFATSTIALGAVMNSLCIFGTKSLGPRSTRELANRCQSVEEFRDRLELLKSKGIVLEEATDYVRLFQKLACDLNEEMFRAVVESDLHHEVYGDVGLQHKLLRSYIASQDWKQANRTIYVLKVLHNKRIPWMWNSILQHFIANGDWKITRQIIDDMMSHQINVSARSIEQLFFDMVLNRSLETRSHASSKTVDDLASITNLWLQLLRAGNEVPAESWNRIHTWLGAEARFDEMETLSLWLAFFYSRRMSDYVAAETSARGSRILGSRRSAAIARELPVSDARHPIQQIFTQRRLQDVIRWGFKITFRKYRNDVSGQWTRGIALVRMLQQYGVPVNITFVRKIVRQRLLILYEGSRPHEKINRRIAGKLNQETLQQTVRRVNEAWEGNLFDIPGESLNDERELRKLMLGKQQPTTNMRPRDRGKSGKEMLDSADAEQTL